MVRRLLADVRQPLVGGVGAPSGLNATERTVFAGRARGWRSRAGWAGLVRFHSQIL